MLENLICAIASQLCAVQPYRNPFFGAGREAEIAKRNSRNRIDWLARTIRYNGIFPHLSFPDPRDAELRRRGYRLTQRVQRRRKWLDARCRFWFADSIYG